MTVLPLVAGVLLDAGWGDPHWLPHPVVGFGKAIACAERRWNRGKRRRWKGALVAVGLIAAVYAVAWGILSWASFCPPLQGVLSAIAVFYCLAAKTLIGEVREVFRAADRSVEEGRKQVARIVGRDTASLTGQEVRTAALETLSENLSDGVVAPLFWYLLLGVPGMLAYKMVNTLDSMVGYKTARYRDFGCWAARIDDAANYLPARLTACLMIVSSRRWGLWKFVWHYGSCHASPNSGYPEAALAGILRCRFGGPHAYFGEVVYKPFIGIHDRLLTSCDMQKALRINRLSEAWMVGLMLIAYLLTAMLR